jgi:lipopolysaccharide transport system ATP-binding protein
MSETIIEVSKLGKQYRLGLVGTTSLVDDFKRYWAKLQGKDDPTLNIGQSNVLDHKHKKSEDEYIWALRDINFNVKQGEVLGIIGKNGAGKSTLLKILSKVTAPSTGEIKIKGRIASLLEVGTGFQAELSGRENIFLNGAILGMTRNEIKSKFDEIVDFSGVERYIDTPVKRYSSGMYVRLAFAVAAHLEPEILIIDEVLAVGDVEFQKKCLGKMKDVSQKDGRTVLFVSHNLSAVTNLCDRVIMLDQGKVLMDADAETTVSFYLNNSVQNKSKVRYWEKGSLSAPGNEYAKFKKIEIRSVNEEILYTEPFSVYIEVDVLSEFKKVHFSLVIYTVDGICVFNSKSEEVNSTGGIISGECFVNGTLLNEGVYNVRVLLIEDYTKVLVDVIDLISFTISEPQQSSQHWYAKWIGITRPELKWTMHKN